MKTQLISSITSFVLGTGVTLASLLTWTGTTDLDAIKDTIQYYSSDVSRHTSALVEDYNVTVDNANAEIGEYKDALAQANDNISQLITAYEEEQAQAEQDLADLQAELDKLYVRMDSKYRTDMNAIIDQANTQINQANDEVRETKEVVVEYINGEKQALENKVNAERHELDTTGSKEVTDISSIVPQE